MMKRQTVATLLVGLIVVSTLSPILTGVVSATHSGNSEYTNNTTESFNELNATSSDNVTVENGAVVLKERQNRTIDGFEDQDLSEYTVDGVAGVSDPTINSNLVVNGSYSVEMEYDQGGDGNPSLSSTSGLNYYPEAGDTFVFWTRRGTTNSGSNRFEWGPNEGSGYGIGMMNNGEIIFDRLDDGSSTTLNSSSVSWSADTWYKVKVHHESSGKIIVEVYQGGSKVGEVIATDSNYTSGGWVEMYAWSGQPNNYAYFDYVHKVASGQFESGNIVQKYDTSLTARQVYLNSTYSGNVTPKIKFGSTGDYVTPTDATWEDLSDGQDVYVRYELNEPSASVDKYELKWREWTTGIWLNEQDPVTMRMAHESSNAVLALLDSKSGATDVSGKVSVDFTEDANFTMKSLNTSAKDNYTAATFSAEASSGEMTVAMDGLQANENYAIYEDGTIWKNVSADGTGTLTISKTSGWSKHNYTVVNGYEAPTNATTDSTDDDEILAPNTCSGRYLPAIDTCIPETVMFAGQVTGSLVSIILVSLGLRNQI